MVGFGVDTHGPELVLVDLCGGFHSGRGCVLAEQLLVSQGMWSVESIS